jgi:hypothetical protein
LASSGKTGYGSSAKLSGLRLAVAKCILTVALMFCEQFPQLGLQPADLTHIPRLFSQKWLSGRRFGRENGSSYG